MEGGKDISYTPGLAVGSNAELLDLTLEARQTLGGGGKVHELKKGKTCVDEMSAGWWRKRDAHLSFHQLVEALDRLRLRKATANGESECRGKMPTHVLERGLHDLSFLDVVILHVLILESRPILPHRVRVLQTAEKRDQAKNKK